MKRIIAIVMALCVLVPSVSYAAGNKALEKARNKEKTAKMKEYKKEGWKLFGSSRSLEVALLTHYDKLNEMGDKAREVPGFATRCKSKNVGKQMAENSAATSYAPECGSRLKGRVVSDMQGDAINTDSEFEKFYAAYERLVEKEIKGELTHSYSIIRENGDGTFEIQSFYIVDEDKASKARVRALENAAKESATAQKYAEQLSAFVGEAFEE